MVISVKTELKDGKESAIEATLVRMVREGLG